jgi:hypothetical protein
MGIPEPDDKAENSSLIVDKNGYYQHNHSTNGCIQQRKWADLTKQNDCPELTSQYDKESLAEDETDNESEDEEEEQNRLHQSAKELEMG